MDDVFEIVKAQHSAGAARWARAHLVDERRPSAIVRAAGCRWFGQPWNTAPGVRQFALGDRDPVQPEPNPAHGFAAGIARQGGGASAGAPTRNFCRNRGGAARPARFLPPRPRRSDTVCNRASAQSDVVDSGSQNRRCGGGRHVELRRRIWLVSARCILITWRGRKSPSARRWVRGLASRHRR